MSENQIPFNGDSPESPDPSDAGGRLADQLFIEERNARVMKLDRPRLRLTAFKITHDFPGACDVAQDVCTRLLEFGPSELHKITQPYAQVMARNMAFNWLRERKPEVSLDPEEVDRECEDPEIRLINAEEAYQQVQRLPERQRVAFILCRMHEHSVQQVAEELGISERAVLKRLQRATLNLKLMHEPLSPWPWFWYFFQRKEQK